MNEAQINGLIRWGLTGLAGFLAAKNLIPAAIGGDLVGYGTAIFTAIVMAIWSIRSNSHAAMASAVAKPGTVVVTDVQTAGQDASPNVVALKHGATIADLKAITVNPAVKDA